MIGRPARRFGPLGQRLLVAFTLVAVSSVLLLSVAALVGTDQGLSAARRNEREQAVSAAALAVADAYRRAGGWADADFGPAQSIASDAGAQLVVRDADMAMLAPGHAPGHAGPGSNPNGAAASTASAPVEVDGQQVGTVTLAFRTAVTSAGRQVAWGWVAGAAVVALLVALAVSGYVTRRLTGPVVSLIATARAFAAGDRGARSHQRGPGEIGELAQTFDRMADDVVRAEQVRRRLAADVAHELRTPLTALQAGLEELRDGLVGADPARLASLHDQSLRLGRVVDDLSQLSAAEAAALSLRLSDVDLSEIVSSALAAQEPQLRSAGLRVVRDVAAPVRVRGDADRLHQVVVNLLANAARYCRADDTVTVRVSASVEQAVVSVADTGPGIQPEDLAHVFDRLRRGKSSGGVSGSGIGLAVVRELVIAHRGTASVSSEPGRGATFTVRLPLAR